MNRRWVVLAMLVIGVLSGCVGRAQVVAKGRTGEMIVYRDAGAGGPRSGVVAETSAGSRWRDAGAASAARNTGTSGAQGATDVWSDVGCGAQRHAGSGAIQGYRDAGAAKGRR